MFGSTFAQAISCAALFAIGLPSIEKWREDVLQLFGSPPAKTEMRVCGNSPMDASQSSEVLPRLVFYGYRDGEAQSVSRRDEILEKGRQGALPVVTDYAIDPFLPYAPAVRGGENSLLYNIESPIPLALSLSYQTQDDLLWDRKTVGDLFELTVFQIQSLPLFKKAFLQLAKTAEMEPPMRRLVGNIQDLQLVSGFDFVTHDDLRKVLNRAFFLFFHAQTKSEFIVWLHQTVIGVANDIYLTQLGGEPLPAYTDKAQRNLIYGPLQTGSIPIAERIGFTIRDRDVSQTIVHLTCAFQNRYEQIAVLIKSEHIEGITQNLKQLTNSRLEIERVE